MRWKKSDIEKKSLCRGHFDVKLTLKNHQRTWFKPEIWILADKRSPPRLFLSQPHHDLLPEKTRELISGVIN